MRVFIFIFAFFFNVSFVFSQASIVETQTNPDTGSARSSVAVTFSDLTEDNTVMALISTRNAAAGISWPSGYTQIYWQESGSGAQAGFAYKVAGASEALTLTVTFTTGDEVSFIAYEVSGLTTDPLDKNAEFEADGSDVTSRTTGTTAAQSQNDVFAVALWSIQSKGAGTPSGRSLTNSYSEETFISGPLAQDIDTVTATKSVSDGSAQECTLSWTSDAARAGGIMTTWKVESAAPARRFIQPIMLNGPGMYSPAYLILSIVFVLVLRRFYR